MIEDRANEIIQRLSELNIDDQIAVIKRVKRLMVDRQNERINDAYRLYSHENLRLNKIEQI